jgi:hypothetical protein
MAAINARGTYDKERYLDAIFDPLVFGPASINEAELIAVRGDEFCAYRARTTTPEGDVHERIITAEVRDGCCVRLDRFPHDRLDDAQIALDRMWLTSLGFAEDHPWFELVGPYYATDSSVIAPALADDFQYLDHRKLSFPDGDRSQIIVNLETEFEAMAVVIPRYLRMSDRHALGERLEQAISGAGQTGGLYVSALGGDGRLAYMEIFDVEDEAAAVACYDRLLADDFASAPAPVPELTNRAWQLALAFATAYATGDRNALDGLLDLDGEVESRGPLNAFGTLSGRDFLDFRLAVRPDAGEGRRDLELVAVRGDHHCLVLVDRWLHGDLMRLPIVVEADDERITHMVWYDEDQLIDAQLELDRRWFESIGYADHWWEPIRLIMYDPHPDAMFEYLAPDFEYIDHRPLMFPSGDAELLRANIDSLQHDVVFTIPRIHRVSDTGSVIERLETGVSELGQTHVVFVGHFVNEKVRRMEAFDITQLDQALARYDELTRG